VIDDHVIVIVGAMRQQTPVLEIEIAEGAAAWEERIGQDPNCGRAGTTRRKSAVASSYPLTMATGGGQT
jgi:hypothetical protein